jgi:hypothetical protein
MTRTTNNQNPPEPDLTSRLSREADRFFDRGGAPLDLGQVLDRAGEIRRGRRMRASMLMAACVLAIAVPTAMVATRADHVAPTPAAPVKIDRSPLTLAGLQTGSEPRQGYVRDNALHVDGFDYTLEKERVVGFAKFSAGLLVAVQDGAGDVRARRLGVAQTWPMEGDFAVSDGGNVAAFVEPDGTVIAVQDGGSRWFELGKLPEGSGFSAIAVQGENCSGRSEAAGCTVYAASHGEQPRTYALQPHQDAVVAGPARTVDLRGDKVAAFASISDSGSCSEVRQRDSVLWSTCDHRLLSFSPDGKHLLAAAAYADGTGDSELAILDSDTGKTAVDLRTADQGVLTRMVWEDDTHVLATVFEKGRWAVIRIGLDGEREYAVPPVPGNDYDGAPFVLPSS